MTGHIHMHNVFVQTVIRHTFVDVIIWTYSELKPSTVIGCEINLCLDFVSFFVRPRDYAETVATASLVVEWTGSWIPAHATFTAI